VKKHADKLDRLLTRFRFATAWQILQTRISPVTILPRLPEAALASRG
jgi:hypothetical protein